MVIELKKIEKGQADFEFTTTLQELQLGNELLTEKGAEKKIKIDVNGDIVNREVHLNINLNGTIELRCARCLDTYEYRLEDTLFKVFKLSQDVSERTSVDETYEKLPLSAEKIEIQDDIRDLILLNIPMKPLCSVNCKGLCSYCGVNKNKEQCNCKRPIDSRLLQFQQFIEN